jgi:hypothetical protein
VWWLGFNQHTLQTQPIGGFLEKSFEFGEIGVWSARNARSKNGVSAFFQNAAAQKFGDLYGV